MEIAAVSASAVASRNEIIVPESLTGKQNEILKTANSMKQEGNEKAPPNAVSFAESVTVFESKLYPVQIQKDFEFSPPEIIDQQQRASAPPVFSAPTTRLINSSKSFRVKLQLAHDVESKEADGMEVECSDDDGLDSEEEDDADSTEHEENLSNILHRRSQHKNVRLV